MFIMNLNFISIFSVLVNECACFLAKSLYDDYDSASHQHITKVSLIQAMEKYAKDSKNATSLYDFYATDKVSRKKNRVIRDKLAELVADTQDRMKHKDFVHCNNEQIEEGHYSIIRCRNSLKTYAMNEEYDAMLQRLGQCLYTLQSFYSNTNWVEMNGERIYEEFGMPGNHTLMTIADSRDMTCWDTTHFNGSCPNNIIVSNKLTSGYHQERGSIKKPARPLGSNTGKCSHGGFADPSRETIAKCGINKDSSSTKYSPHNQLHEQATRAAIAASVFFLSERENGLIDFLGTRIFDDLFHIKMRTEKSLGIAIDYTMSMTEDINQVRDGVLQLLSSVVGSGVEPKHYVLSLFNDPERYNKLYKFENATDMIEAIQKVTVFSQDNPDCPELSVTGMINAVNLSLNHSPVFAFTDATAKDKYRKVRLVEMVKEKNITLVQIVKNDCETRRLADIGKRSTSFYEELAKETGGIFYSSSNQPISNILLELLNDFFPSSEVLLYEHHWTTSDSNFLEIPVDSTIDVLKIRVIGSSSISDVNYYTQNGIIEDFTKTSSNRYRTSNGETIISIQKPVPGTVKLGRIKNVDMRVNVTAQSPIILSVDIYKDNVGILTRLFGNPIAKAKYYIEVRLSGLNENGTFDHFAFRFSNGSLVERNECSTKVNFDGDEIVCWGFFMFPEGKIVIEAIGKDSYNVTFKRQYWRTYVPTDVELLSVSVEDEAILNARSQIQYELVNRGSLNVSYVTFIKSTRPDFLLQPTSVEYLVAAGKSKVAAFSILPTIPSVVFKYTIEVKKKHESTVLQALSEDILVTDVERPVCTLEKVIGWCDKSFLNTRNCSLKTWKVDAEINFNGVELKKVYVKGESVILTHDNFTDVDHGPIMTTATGDCCSPTFQMTIIDNDYFLVQCLKLFSEDGIVTSVESFPLDSSTEMSSTLIIAISCSTGVIMVILIFAFSIISMRLEKGKMDKLLLKAPPQKEMVSSKPTFYKFSLRKGNMYN